MKYITRTINELCLKITDGAHNSPEEDINGLYPMYSSKDMLYDGFDTENIKMISGDVYNKLVKQDCRPLENDILIIKDGNSYLKYAFRVKENIDAVILSSIAILRPNTDEIDPDFFVYMLRTNSIRNAMANYVSGAAIPRIVLKDFKKMKLQFCADRNTQSEIARILLEYDNLINNNTKRIKILEQMEENIYKEWFVRFRFPEHEYVENEGGIPKNWKIVRIGDRFKTVLGGTPSREKPEYWGGNIPWINSGEINRLRITKGSEQITEEGYKKSATELMPPHTTVVAITGATLGQVSFTEIEVCANQSVVGIIDEEHIIEHYLFGVIKQNIGNLINFASGGAQQHINKDVINKYKIVLPPIEVVCKYEEYVRVIDREIYSLTEQNEILKKQRDLLLPRLISGKLQV